MRSNQEWNVEKMPDLRGRVAVVTGANSGIGYETSAALADRGAHVVLACRNLDKANNAARRMCQAIAGASLEIIRLDLADLAAVRAFADTFRERHESLDLLINNAGLMAAPFRETADGFEMHFGVNHLGHFALTGLLLGALLEGSGIHGGSRVVTVSSGMHVAGRRSVLAAYGEEKGRYNRWVAYGDSKLANLLFAYELQRRFDAAGSKALSVAASPGYVATNLQTTGLEMDGSRLQALFLRLGNRLVAQSAAQGALPTLYAATASEVNSCDYITPGGLFGLRGWPQKARSSAASYDEETAGRLWEVSRALSGVRYEALET